MNYKISESDRKWVEKNFLYLIKICGFPLNEGVQLILNQHFFPKTLNSNKIAIEPVIQDLTNALKLNLKKINYEIVKDLRDAYGTPLIIQGKDFETDLQISNEKEYRIYISNALLNRPNRLLFCLINEFVKIQLSEFGIPYEDSKDLELFLFLAGIYWGFGVILTQKRIDVGRSTDGFWESNWKFASAMPDDIIVYTLALYLKIFSNSEENWTVELPNEIKCQLNEALDLIDAGCSIDITKNELEAEHFNYIAYYEQGKVRRQPSYEYLQKVIEKSKNKILIASAYNNLGYAQIKEGLINESVPNFKESIKFRPNFGYANDNLGYCLILLGEIEEGLKYLKKALDTGNNDKGYSYRNHALYYHRKGDLKRAKEYYDLAFRNIKIPIDFLEFHFSELLFEMGDTEKGMSLLEQAVNKGELIAIKKYNEINRKE